MRPGESIIEQLRGGLIVSCQALEDEIFYRPEGGLMPLFARAAECGGAVGIRANSVRDINEIRKAVNLPIIGIIKRDLKDSPVYITPELRDVEALVATGVEIIALDCTDRPRSGGQSLTAFLSEVRAEYPEQLFMADCATFHDAILAAQHGMNLIGTTLCGYTEDTKGQEGVPYKLIEELVRELDRPIIAEGHIDSPEALARVMALGVHAAVVGSAITRPLSIVQRFVAALPDRS